MFRLRTTAFITLGILLISGITTLSSAQEINSGINRPSHIALDAASGTMFWSNINSGRVLSARLDGTGSAIVVCNFRCAGETSQILGFNTPDGVAVNTRTDQLFWTDPLGGQIWRANLDGSEPVNILCRIDPCASEEGIEVETLRAPKSLAVDPNRGQIYWTDEGSDHIMRANLDGTESEVLVCREDCDHEFDGIDRPAGITLDLREGRIYWTELNGSGIRRSNLNGSNPENVICRSECEGGVVLPDLFRPTGIVIDAENDKIYWSDQFEARIQRSNFDGSEIENVLCAEECEGGVVQPALNSPRGIAIDDDAGKIYWVEGDTNEVWRANLDGSESELLLCDSGC